MEDNQVKIGSIAAASAYLIWGFLPLFWRAVGSISPGAILSHRIVWSFVFMILLIVLTGNAKGFIKESQLIFRDGKKTAALLFASLVITGNWLLFIWAVNSNYVVQASLGYYINPLISILLGVFVLKESLTKVEITSVFLAGFGVVFLTFYYGVFPWVSLVLALTFALYALVKKTVAISTMSGLTLETLIVLPPALIYLWVEGESLEIMSGSLSMAGLLMCAGVVTAIPLLLFAVGAKRIPLSLIGFLQYIAPTLMLIIGVFLFNESFTYAHFIAFLSIWAALGIYTASRFMRIRQLKRQLKRVN
ncbi:chloramphenicol-sensitive protein RarD [Amphibacillus marinus]|uniref:Chloramphenicol-sensitive protein RarD n=1 Tax=Amphibacillus marinus TaxID=872970 RepID=A0A1H8K8B5_9BACI|nr:EamA family transporter RarD [Amphibacillus marinus]SEN89203.1 chloramphenicol-sensitive protein RarD [Amphibacillus marinus]